jgi:hypothetical protein
MKVPDQYMIPIGARYTKELEKCADSWSDSEVAIMRAELPPEYHAVPLDELRRQWINLRKRAAEGFRLNGVGPSIGSRKRGLPPVDPRYAEYLNSEDWKRRRLEWLRYWGGCCICNDSGKAAELNVHHRTYVRVGREEFKDCVVLCRNCHELFETKKAEKKELLFA